MPERIDRSMQSNRLLLVAVIVIAAVVASVGVMLWLRMPATKADRKPAMQDRESAQRFLRDEPLSIKLYYPADGMLAAVSAAVKRQPDTQSQAREALAALFADQRTIPAPVLRDIMLRAFYLDASGTAYIDLAPSPRKEVLASAWEEQLAIYAMVNTLVQNFEEIKQVSILFDGREAQTLAGHIDLSRMFTKRMDLVKQ